MRAAGGGIELMDGFQTNLTGLTQTEALCLFLVGQPLVAHRLGLGAPTTNQRFTPPAEFDLTEAWSVHASAS